MRSSAWIRWGMGLAIALMIVLVPFVYYRMTFAGAKRLRPVTAGKVYRSGCLTADGFREAIRKFGIRTVINLQEEAPDPSLPRSFFSRAQIRESEVCRDMGVRFVFLEVDTLIDSLARC